MNSYDQRGLELDKKLAGAILPKLRVPGDVSSHDSSTDGPPIKRRQEGSGSAGG